MTKIQKENIEKFLENFKKLKSVNEVALILFGSLARNDGSNSSDYDFLIITKKSYATRKEYLANWNKYFIELDRDYDLKIFDLETYNKSTDLLIQNIKRDGVYLYREENVF